MILLKKKILYVQNLCYRKYIFGKSILEINTNTKVANT